MLLTSPIHVVAIGCAGGVCSEFLHWWALRQSERFPDYAGRVSYWIITAIMILVGGFVAWLYFGGKGSALVVFHVGLSAPLILQKLAASIPDPPGGKGQRKTCAKDFFRW